MLRIEMHVTACKCIINACICNINVQTFPCLKESSHMYNKYVQYALKCAYVRLNVGNSDAQECMRMYCNAHECVAMQTALGVFECAFMHLNACVCIRMYDAGAN